MILKGRIGLLVFALGMLGASLSLDILWGPAAFLVGVVLLWDCCAAALAGVLLYSISKDLFFLGRLDRRPAFIIKTPVGFAQVEGEWIQGAAFNEVRTWRWERAGRIIAETPHGHLVLNQGGRYGPVFPMSLRFI